MSFSIPHSPPPSPNPVPAPLPPHPCVTHCPELDLSVTLSPAPKADLMQHKACRLKQSRPQLRPHPQGQTERKRNAKVRSEESLAVRVRPEPHIAPLQQPVRAPRGSSGYHHVGRHSVDPAAAGFVRDPGCLESAELNSTLALKVELQSLQEMEFDSQKALQEILQKSGRTKTLINARATEVVNVSRSQQLFNSLVSVNVQEDELLSQALQARLTLAPPPSRCYDKAAEGPSLNFFISPELFRNKPLPQEEEPAKWKPSPVACPAHSTFDLYRRQRCWEATH
ncbi:protein phosphatase 1 regulatory subunit 35 isoform 1-T2 [Anableps anableps]